MGFMPPAKYSSSSDEHLDELVENIASVSRVVRSIDITAPGSEAYLALLSRAKQKIRECRQAHEDGDTLAASRLRGDIETAYTDMLSSLTGMTAQLTAKQIDGLIAEGILSESHRREDADEDADRGE